MVTRVARLSHEKCEHGVRVWLRETTGLSLAAETLVNGIKTFDGQRLCMTG